MSIEKKQIEAFKTLKIFNNAVTTSRLYPENSPQVAAAEGKAYDAVQNYTQAHGELSFGKEGDEPWLCGHKASEDLQSQLLELIIFRHLGLLKLNHAVLWPSHDRQGFGTILSAFIARKESIDKEGGGRPFVDGLGLEQYFPHEYEPKPEKGAEEPPPSFDLQVDTRNVPEGALAYLFDEHTAGQTNAALELILNDPEQVPTVVLAGVARVLKAAEDRTDKLAPFVSSRYTAFLINVGDLIVPDKLKSVTEAISITLLDKLNEPMLALIYGQKYPKGFAQQLFNQLTMMMPADRFDGVIRQMHHWLRDFINCKTTKTPDAQTIGLVLKTVLETPKGKQFIGREKARSLMKSGERERKERRLETGISALLSGGAAGLRSEEVLASLPSQLKKLLSEGKTKEAERLIRMMVEGMLGGDSSLRARLIIPFVEVGETLLRQQRWQLLEMCRSSYLVWIKASDEGDSVYKRTVLLLMELMNHAWDTNNTTAGEKILKLFHQIRTGYIAKSGEVKKIVVDVQDRSYNRPFYQTLLDRFLEVSGDSIAGQRLIMMGRPAGDFILENLLREEEPANRLKIVDLLGDMGPVAKDLIFEKLPNPMPWYGKRNLLKLAGFMAGPTEVEAVYPFLRHDDIRVQREAFVSIYTMSGEQRKQALIRCLSESSEAMRSQVVKALLPYSDAEVAHHLAMLLEDQEHYSEDIREQLVREIINVLSRSRSAEAKDSLLAFLNTREKKINRKLDPTLWRAAEMALSKVEDGLEELALSTPRNRDSESSVPDDAGLSQPDEEVDFESLPEVAQIKQLVNEDRLVSAKDQILKLIGEFAAKGNFEDAEKLRTWLVEIDPMALSDIIRASEIIDEEKIASVEKIDIEAWSELYDELSTEEFATFIHATERKNYNNEDIIFNQGDMQSGLYFINSGTVKVYYHDTMEENLIKAAEKGDILGADTIVDASVWTVSAACLNSAELMYLDGSELQRWREEYPALETKINNFCKKYASLQEYFGENGRDRRTAQRYGLNGKVTSVLLDDNLQDTGFSTQGDLYDVACGGLSFFMRISQKKHARVLLGRNIKVMVPMEGATGRQIDIFGSIIAARSRQNVENEYSIHIKFNEELPSANLQALIKTNA